MIQNKIEKKKYKQVLVVFLTAEISNKMEFSATALHHTSQNSTPRTHKDAVCTVSFFYLRCVFAFISFVLNIVIVILFVFVIVVIDTNSNNERGETKMSH